ncbi:MAG: 16S rRNA (cytosine(1402)-N(4))-methyltransferase RsmH, partial [Gemmatimonadaceae bacterium]
MLVHSAYHAPVLAAEVTELLRNANQVLDCTLGGGGHTVALFEAGVQSVVGVDRDPEALASSVERLHVFAEAARFSALESNYSELSELPALDGMTFDGILLDLGISSHQVDKFERGFTFRPGARLDMRMSSTGASAADLLNDEDEESLELVFKLFGDEPKARGLAREIVRRRETIPFATSDELVGAIRAVLGKKSGSPDFARLFQAVRIAVNDELPGLTRALPALRDRLTPGGTLVVITYHSGEDRIVKNFFRDWSANCICPPKHPMCTCRG